MSGALLEVHDLAVRFGGVVALAGVSLAVDRGEIRGVIGPNGSGKTTLFNCVSGLYRPMRGDIRLEGKRLTGLPRHRMAGLGIGRTFQNLALFPTLTVRQNVLVGAHCLGRSGFLANALRLARVREEEEAAGGRLGMLLEMLDLAPLADARATDVPFAVAKRVELARALIGAPKLLLLDEPASGLNHAEVAALESLLRRIRSHFALSIVLVEHHMNLVMRVSDRVAALELGRKIADGTPQLICRDPEVIRAYLGETEHVQAA
jgi:branched-chain amino acid transport system ATP-binding protein